MAESESVQYFQFDEQGNMFVFAPGAGMTGNVTLVRPGDDLIFSSVESVNETQLQLASQSTVTLASDTQCAAMSSQRSYHVPFDDGKIEEFTHKKFSPETNKKIKWVIKMYSEWREYRNSRDDLENVPCDLRDRSTITPDSLIFGVSRFITEVKKLDGSDFPGKTLYDLVICIQFHLETMGIAWHLLSNEMFNDVKFTLDNMMKLRTSQGIGLSVRKAQVLSKTDEDFLWSCDLLGCKNPQMLLNTVVFLVGKGFALRAGKEHQVLRSPPFGSQFEFMRDPDGVLFIRYKEEVGLDQQRRSKTQKSGS